MHNGESLPASQTPSLFNRKLLILVKRKCGMSIHVRFVVVGFFWWRKKPLKGRAYHRESTLVRDPSRCPRKGRCGCKMLRICGRWALPGLRYSSLRLGVADSQREEVMQLIKSDADPRSDSTWYGLLQYSINQDGAVVLASLHLIQGSTQLFKRQQILCDHPCSGLAD